MLVRALTAILLAVLALVPVACGGDEERAAFSSATASIVPAGSAYVELDSNLDSAQWTRLRALAAKFPGSTKLVDLLEKELASEDLDWETDLDPALGDKVLLVFRPGESVPIVLTQPDDESKLDALIEKGDEETFKAEIEGWTAIADNQDNLDEYRRALEAGSLADDEDFRNAMDGLSQDALARAFVPAETVERALSEAGASVQASALGEFQWLGAALTAEESGLRLEGAVSAPGFESGASYKPELLAKVPEGALAVLSFKGLDKSLSQLRDNPALSEQLPQVERALGVTLDEIAELFAGEVALYVRPGSPIPEVTLLLADAGEAELNTLDELASRLSLLVQARTGSDEVDGIQLKYVEVQGVRVYYGTFDGMVVVTTSSTGIRDLRSDGDKLSDDAAFARASEAAGLGDETSGFLYVNLGDVLPLIEGFAALAGEPLPDEVRDNLEPLDSLVVHASRDGDEFRFTAYLGVR